MTNEERGVRLFAELFPPNPNRHGIMRNYDPATGKKSVYSVTEKVTLDMVAAHLQRQSHKGRLGYMPGDATGTDVGMIDIDRRAYGESFERIVSDVKQALSLAGVSWYEEVSTNGGSHIFVFCAERLPYEAMYYFLRAFTDEAGHAELETFPSNASSGVASRWLLLPYAGALLDEEQLGLTWLRDRNGKPVPLNLLNNVVRNEAKALLLHAERWREDTHQQQLHEAKQDTASVQDLDPTKAWAELQRAVEHPPPTDSGWHRHDAIIAFINLSQRANRVAEMVELLKTEDVWRLWTRGDGSRDHETWQEEIDRWHARWLEDADKLRPRHGIKHLLDAGWQLGRLKRAPSVLFDTGQNLNKLPEDELAEAAYQLLEDRGMHWAYDPARQTAYRYDGKTWVTAQDHVEAVKRQLEGLLKERGLGLRESKLTAVYKKLERNWLVRSLNDEADHRYICCLNGLLNWRTGELVPHTHTIVTIGMVNAEWDPDVDGHTGRFQDHLRAALKGNPHRQELIEIMQEFCGYSLTREVRMRAMLDLHGKSSTGKTTTWRVLLGVMGNRAEDGPHSPALATSADQDIFDAQDWGAHFVSPTLMVFDEINTADGRTGRKIVNNFKRLSGGGEIVVNPKGRTSVVTRTATKIMLCTNFDMRLREDASTDTIFRRLVRIPFENEIKADAELGRQDLWILDGDRERERIFKWMVEGLQRVERQGWQLSHSGIRNKQVEDSRKAANPVVLFLEECCVVHPDYETESSVLREEFIAWTHPNGYAKHFGDITYQSFGLRMSSALSTLGWSDSVTVDRPRLNPNKRGKRSTVYKGLMILETR